VTRRQIAEFVEEGSFFDPVPRFDPAPDTPESEAPQWGSFTLHYQDGRRPIRFERNLRDELLKEELDELLFILERSKKTKTQQEMLERLRETQQVIGIEVDREALTDDGWEMLDAVESFLATRCDGIVYVPDEGFFDANLRPVYRL